MDLIAFIHAPDPTKVRVMEREREVDEPRLLDIIVGRTVPVLPVAPDRADNELEASIERLFDEGGSGIQTEQRDSARGGPDTEIQLVVKAADTIAKEAALVRSRRLGKRKYVVVDAGGLPILLKLREDHGTSCVTSVGAKVDSLVRSSTPVMTTATAVTSMVDSTLVTKEKTVKPSLFSIDSSLASEADPNTSVFSDLTGSDFLFFASVHEMEHDQLFTEFNVGVARQIFLCVEVKMRAEYNVKEKRRLEYVVEEKDELLEARDEEIENLKAQMLLKEAEAAEAIPLCVEASNFESVKKSLWDEVNALKERNTTLKKERNALDVHELELSSSGLQEKVTLSVNLSRKVCRTGSAGITHGKEGRVLTDVASYNPSTKVDYISALQQLQNVNFPLFVELRSNKDASIEALINVIRLEEPLVDKLGLNELQPHGTSDVVSATADTTTALSTTFASASTIAPISVDDYEVVGTNEQEDADGNAEPFPNIDDAELNIPHDFVTSYGPSHLGPSFPVSYAQLASLFRYTRSRLISRASMSCIRSTTAILSVGMPISAGMTTSVLQRFALSTKPLVCRLLRVSLSGHNLLEVALSTITMVRGKIFCKCFFRKEFEDRIHPDHVSLFRDNSILSGFVSISPSSEPSVQDDPFVNKINCSGSSSSTFIGVSKESSSGRSTMKFASICPLTDVIGPDLVAGTDLEAGVDLDTKAGTDLVKVTGIDLEAGANLDTKARTDLVKEAGTDLVT
uniref:Transposase (Putative), gypsy type n=1 Tax=Tanacetum cinerariifolium TaxID=118510 RepID=A0A699H2V6_TANCI|nr:hypothetical protein [Tanacetum cinerariifolium]